MVQGEDPKPQNLNPNPKHLGSRWQGLRACLLRLGAGVRRGIVVGCREDYMADIMVAGNIGVQIYVYIYIYVCVCVCTYVCAYIIIGLGYRV